MRPISFCKILSSFDLRAGRFILGRTGLSAALVIAAQSVAAQGVSTNDVTNCSIIADPTAQRLCIESARQSRPASTFDPTAEKLNVERRSPVRRDALSVRDGREGRAQDAEKRPERRTGAPDAKRTDWRLQIP